MSLPLKSALSKGDRELNVLRKGGTINQYS